MAKAQLLSLKNEEMPEKLAMMINNEKFSDTTFLVNNSKFHASRHLLCAYSSELDSIIDDHFKHCGDREIRIGQIKQESSFLVILKYIYGLDITLDQKNTNILCEVLSLSDRFKITQLTQKLKSFISELDCFDMNSVVMLLNTAIKIPLKDLYQKLFKFACENANLLVRHESFKNLEYPVLRDLLKSNCFAALEIDILVGVLTWHQSNMNINPSSLDVVFEKNIDKNNKKSKYRKKRAACIDENIENSDISSLGSIQKDNGDIVETFSKNVMKSLLALIRMNRISVLEMFRLTASELYVKYKEFIVDGTYFSQNVEPRSLTHVASKSFEAKDLPPLSLQFHETKVFDIKWNFSNSWHFDSSDEKLLEHDKCYEIGGMTWTICLKKEDLYKSGEYNCLEHMYLKCTADSDSDWQSVVEIQMRRIPNPGTNAPVLIIPDSARYTSIWLVPENSCVNIGEFLVSDEYEYDYFKYQHDYLQYEVDFKSIETKINDNDKLKKQGGKNRGRKDRVTDKKVLKDIKKT